MGAGRAARFAQRRRCTRWSERVWIETRTEGISMPHQVTMPMLGLTMEEGTITEWLKQEGETVDKEEPLFVVETDKSAVEVGAPASGIVQKILVPVGQTVKVSAAIAVIAQPGEAVVGATPSAPAGPAEDPAGEADLPAA